jgi:hypothetical protein
MNQATKKTLIWTYVIIGVLTLAFQIYVRSPVCAEAGNCALSYAKAAVWSVIWPASWIAYLKGQI